MTRLSFLLALCLPMTACAAAGPGHHHTTPAPTAPDGTARDTHALRTWDGSVAAADGRPASDQLEQTLRLALSDDPAHPVAVVLAPGWFLEREGLHYTRDEHLRVKGTTRTRDDGEETVIAWEVEQQGHTIRLRDERGRPLWEATPPAADPPAPATE